MRGYRLAIILAVIAMVGSLMTEACSKPQNTSTEAETSLEDMISTEVTEEESTEITATDIGMFVSGAEDYYVLEMTKNFDAAAMLLADQNLIRGVIMDASGVDYNTTGEYPIIYKFVIDEENYTKYANNKGSYRADFGVVSVLDKAEDTDITVDFTRTITVVTQEEAEELAEKNIPVYTEDGGLVVGTVEVERPSVEELNQESESYVSEIAESESASRTAESTKVAEASRPAETTQAPETTRATETTKAAETTNAPETTTAHTHNWVAQTTTVHHDAEYTNQWVVDKAAYDETVVVQAAWDEQVPVTEIHEVCDCGLDFTATNMSHDARLDHGYECAAGGGWGTTPVVVGTTTVHHEAVTQVVHHDEEGHYEQVLVKAAYDETVTTGYKCSVCGATQ